MYVADTGNNLIRKITSAGDVTTVAGKIPDAFDDAVFTDGIGSVARFNQPTGVTVGSDGYLYVADYGNARIRKVDLETDEVMTLANGGSFSSPQDLVMDSLGNLYVADSLNNRVRKIDSSGVITTVDLSAELLLPTGFM